MKTVKKYLLKTFPYSIQKYKELFIKIKYFQAENKFKHLKKDEKLSVVELQQMAVAYKHTAKYQKARICLATIIEKQPQNVQALFDKAEITYWLGLWKECVEEFKYLQNVLDKKKDPDLDDAEKMWLDANKKIVNAHLRLKNHNDNLMQRNSAFIKLGGVSDVLELLKANHGTDCPEIKTEMFTSGESGFYTCVHFTDGGRINIVEKCCTTNSSEPDIYKTIDRFNLFKKNTILNTPELRGMVKRTNYVKLFLSYEDGVKLSKIPADKIDFFKLGYLLGEIGKEFSGVEFTKNNNMKPMKNFDARRAQNTFSKYDREEVKKYVSVIEKFFLQKKKLESIINTMPKVFSHNDAGLQNILLSNSQRYVMLDWERAGYNCAGSDLGNVLISTNIRKAEAEGLSTNFEDQMVEGYLESISGAGINVSKEELIIGYNLHFINAKLKGAIDKNNFNLFKRIADRCELVKKLAGI